MLIKLKNILLNTHLSINVGEELLLIEAYEGSGDSISSNGGKSNTMSVGIKGASPLKLINAIYVNIIFFLHIKKYEKIL
jgi:hypothetical protein